MKFCDEAKWECKECNKIWVYSELLVASNPFSQEDKIFGCPNCKHIGNFEEICAEISCERHATCGGPDASGFYRRTCMKHAEWLKEQK